MKLNLRLMLIVAAVYFFLNGLGALLAPPDVFGVKVDDSTPMFLVAALRFWGVATLPLGLIAWLIRNAEASKTRDAVVLSFTFFFILEAAVSFYASTFDPASPHVPFAVIEAVIGIGFLYVARRSMATNPG